MAARRGASSGDKKVFQELAQGANEKFTPSNQQPHEIYVNESGRLAEETHGSSSDGCGCNTRTHATACR